MAKVRRASIGITVANDPITPAINIVTGTVPPLQYKSEGEWSPDYSVTNLVLTPSLEVYDPDNSLSGQIPAFDIGSKWEAVENGVRNELASNTDHAIAANTYALSWKKNLNPGDTVVLIFTGVFMAGGTAMEARATVTMRCLYPEQRIPRLELDRPTSQKFIYVREVPDMEIHAQLVGGSGTFTPTGTDPNCAFLWFRKNSAGKWMRVYPSNHASYDIMDYDITVDPNDSSKITIHRDMMGQRAEIMCRAWYSEDGKIYGGAIAESASYGSDGSLNMSADIADSPAAFYATERYLGKTVQGIHDIRETYTSDVSTISPRAYMEDSRGMIDDLGKHFNVKWKANNTVIAQGINPDIAVASVAGKDFVAEIEERGSLKAVTSNNKVLTYNGKILLTN